MALVYWKDDYSVGTEPVDDEHKALIERINRLYDQLMVEDEPSAVAAFFEALVNAITMHFALEERFLREHGYEQLPQQREDFERLLDEIVGLVDEFDRDEETGRDDLAARLDGWLSSHSETHDARIEDVFGRRPN
ncbi:bacteriohemerythrin [Bradyrhizobium sp.]|uniref:bacteriohemerythrin n=1 Tax=Bradyrhizobium sp. TaxID=376 RepID=UPI002384DDDC|nr:bacteriohemerythrin [Bradyrhizobium sp.]MDE2376057.1 hemerythrin family protein [Bradyrhizobium sp.]